MTVVIVGAGIAGLLCARALVRAGRSVRLLEREADVGGRVRSRLVDGYVVDRGFQVLFTAYPTLRAALDLDGAGGARLALRRFLPAARLGASPRAGLVGDALRDPSLLLPTLAAHALPVGDLLRLAALRAFARARTIEECFAPAFDGQSARDFLRGRGFSAAALHDFFAPFYGGILLDPTLATAASVLLFTFKMLAEGDTVVPAAGIGAIPRALASALPADTVRTGVDVVALTVVDGRATGVRTADGREIPADAVVLAGEGPAIDRLLGVSTPAAPSALGCATVHLAAATAPLPGRAIWLAPRADATIAHAVTLTEVAPEYATPDARHGRHLLAATAVGPAAARDDATLVRDARATVHALRASARLAPLPDGALAVVAIERVAYAQFAQPPGAAARRTGTGTPYANVWRATEQAHTSSLEGAARGGELAAAAVLAPGGARATAR